ncbi:MAG: DinB family protein [Planctomycetota bacterium]
MSRYTFLVDTFATEILKVATVWSQFTDRDLDVRPRADDPRGRSPREHMVHQCVSENLWFANMLGIRVTDQPLPATETRLAFIEHYTRLANARWQALGDQDDAWWEEEVAFFEVQRSRAWVMTRRIAHTAHHRGQQTAMLRALGGDLHSTYGPTADTGGLMQNQAPVIYAYPHLEALLAGERAGGTKAALPGTGPNPPTERPDSAG